jgi:hypothetical protein
MKRIIYHVTFIVVYMAFICTAQAQTDTIRVKDKKLLTGVLKPGLKQYMVYRQIPEKNKNLNISLWTREIKTGIHKNEPVFIVTQYWYAADTLQYRHITSVNRRSDFSPVYHLETIGPKTKAFNWYNDTVKGADTVAVNVAKGFTQALAMPVYNWNLDIETFEMLPLAAGKSFAIPFYDAGTQPPKYVVYQVAGSEVLNLFGSVKTDCWKLVTKGEFNGRKYTQTFWITKKTHEFLKEEDAFNGTYRYKIKLPGNTPNILPLFKQ